MGEQALEAPARSGLAFPGAQGCRQGRCTRGCPLVAGLGTAGLRGKRLRIQHRRDRDGHWWLGLRWGRAPVKSFTGTAHFFQEGKSPAHSLSLSGCLRAPCPPLGLPGHYPPAGDCPALGFPPQGRVPTPQGMGCRGGTGRGQRVVPSPDPRCGAEGPPRSFRLPNSGWSVSPMLSLPDSASGTPKVEAGSTGCLGQAWIKNVRVPTVRGRPGCWEGMGTEVCWSWFTPAGESQSHTFLSSSTFSDAKLKLAMEGSHHGNGQKLKSELLFSPQRVRY